MYYLAFDVSKNKLDGVLTNLRTKTEYFSLDNNYQSIIDWLNKTKLPKKIVSGCESTGGYHLLIMRIFVERSFVFKLVNPLLVKQFTRTTIRKKKTDLSDSLIIAKLLSQNEGQMISFNDLDITAKVLQRGLRKLIKEKHRFSLMSQNIGLQENKELLSLERRYKKLEKNIKEEIKEYTLSLEKEYSQESVIQLLTTIPGIGFKSAFTIWTEIGDINRFDSSKKLVAFAGLDPKIRQSGHCLNNQGKITKRGSPHLRQALFVAASVARMHDPELKAYYEKKRSEGKKYTVAVCAVTRKLINRIYVVWKRQRPYIIRKDYNLVNLKAVTKVATT